MDKIKTNRRKERMNVVDLFCGAGGLSLGFSMAGFEISAAYDNWGRAIETYKENLNHKNIKLLDLTELKKADHPEIIFLKSLKPFVLSGGPPCQDFSSAGKRNSEGERGNLTPLFAEIAVAVLPRWVVMENVNTIKTTGEKQLSKAKEIFRKAGYGITVLSLNAADFGVPQKRKRIFLIARLGGKDGEIEDFIKKQQIQKQVSIKEYFDKVGVNLNGYDHYYRHPRSYGRRAIFSMNEPSMTIRGVNRPMPKTYKFHENDPVKVRERVMVFSAKERSIIQTFPLGYKWAGNKSEIEQQIGNAVPPILVKAIGKAILEFEKAYN